MWPQAEDSTPGLNSGAAGATPSPSSQPRWPSPERRRTETARGYFPRTGQGCVPRAASSSAAMSSWTDSGAAAGSRCRRIRPRSRGRTGTSRGTGRSARPRPGCRRTRTRRSWSASRSAPMRSRRSRRSRKSRARRPIPSSRDRGGRASRTGDAVDGEALIALVVAHGAARVRAVDAIRCEAECGLCGVTVEPALGQRSSRCRRSARGRRRRRTSALRRHDRAGLAAAVTAAHLARLLAARAGPALDSSHGTWFDRS